MFQYPGRILVPVLFLFLWGVATQAKATSSYQELRGIVGQPGDIQTLSAERIGGVFRFLDSDPNGYGDDEGIVIQAPNGWWVRQFPYSLDDPIEFDWFEFSDEDDITSTIGMLSETYTPDLYVRMPTVPMTLRMDETDFSDYGIRRLGIIQSDAPVVLKQKSMGNQFLQISEGYDELTFGVDLETLSRAELTLTVEGSYSFQNRGIRSIDSNEAMIDIRQTTSCGCDVHLRFNTKNARNWGVKHWGMGGPRTVFFGGAHETSNLYISAADKIVYEDVLVSDPDAVGLGWLGLAAGDSDLENFGNAKATTVQTIFSEMVTGRVTFQYGYVHFLGMLNEKFGEGPSDPFTVVLADAGYTKSGVKVIKSKGVGYQSFKIDMVDKDTWDIADQRHIRIIENNQYGNNISSTMTIEASSRDDSAGLGSDAATNLDFVLVNTSGEINANMALFDGDRIDHLSYRGDGTHPANVLRIRLSDSNTVRDGQFNDILINRLRNGSGGKDNMLRNVTLTGSVTVDPGIIRTTLTDVTWIGASRVVMDIGVNSDVTGTNFCAPNGATVEGSGSLVLNGVQRGLPYTIQGSDCRERNPEIPLPTANSTGLDAPTGVTIERSRTAGI